VLLAESNGGEVKQHLRGLMTGALATRITKVTSELRTLQNELRAATREQATDTELVDHLISSDLLVEFKMSVDGMRMFLWAYIDMAAKAELKKRSEDERLSRVTELLRMIHAQTVEQQPATFLDTVDAMIEKKLPLAKAAAAPLPGCGNAA